LSVSKKQQKPTKTKFYFLDETKPFKFVVATKCVCNNLPKHEWGMAFFILNFSSLWIVTEWSNLLLLLLLHVSIRFDDLFFLNFILAFCLFFYRFVCAGTHRHETHKTHNKNTWEKWSTQIAPSIIFNFFVIFSAISFWFSWFSFILMECLFLICPS
jgi:hypothetical protein